MFCVRCGQYMRCDDVDRGRYFDVVYYVCDSCNATCFAKRGKNPRIYFDYEWVDEDGNEISVP